MQPTTHQHPYHHHQIMNMVHEMNYSFQMQFGNKDFTEMQSTISSSIIITSTLKIYLKNLKNIQRIQRDSSPNLPQTTLSTEQTLNLT